MKKAKAEKAKRIVEKLLSYPAHDFVINFDEAKRIGLNVDFLPAEITDLVWRLYRVIPPNLMRNSHNSKFPW